MVSLSQATELGTVYTPDELQALVAYCHAHQLVVHMDGARLFHAAASLGTTLAALTSDVGVDVLSLGGTKNGTMWGDAVIFLQGRAAPDFARYRKQSLQLAAKMRFVAAQFCALLADDLWRRNAAHAVAAAQYLEEALVSIKQVRVTQAVQANAVFATVPRPWVKPLKRSCFFYVWDQATFEVRWITAFDTERSTIDKLVNGMHQLAEG
jgi:threonine aldolase